MMPITPETKADSRTRLQGLPRVIVGWVGKNRDQLLVKIVGTLIAAGVLALIAIFRTQIALAIRAAATWISRLTEPISVPLWLLLALPILALLLLILVQYFRQYRYRKDTVVGLDFAWFYLTPFGRVVRVRAFCPVCRKPALEPTSFIHYYSNYLCRNCGYNTTSRDAQRMEYPWRTAIQRRVYARLYKPPAA